MDELTRGFFFGGIASAGGDGVLKARMGVWSGDGGVGRTLDMRTERGG